MTRPALLRWTAALLGTLVVAAGGFLVHSHVYPPTRVTAIFSSANAVYAGDDVRIAGVKVGTISDIRPDGTQAVLELEVDAGVRVPADANAVIVAQNLISARFVGLTPWHPGAPRMADGTTIPLDRTAVPVEWDEVKEQLTRLATDLGPAGQLSTSSVGRFIDSAAGAMDGNGEKLRETMSQLAAVSRVIARGSSDITEMISNLQTFVAVLRDTNTQIVSFQDRLATLSSVLDASRDDLDASLTNLAEAVDAVQRFVSGSRDQTSEQVRRLLNVTQNVVDHQADLEQVLHIAPSALANSYNMMDPRTGGASGVFVLNNLSNPSLFFCGMIGALENVTSVETGKLCGQFLGPGLDRLNFNYLPFPVNPLLSAVPSPGKMIYTDPDLEPGGPGTSSGPMTIDPADSAYQATGTAVPVPGPIAPPPPSPEVAPDTSDQLPSILRPAESPP